MTAVDYNTKVRLYRNYYNAFLTDFIPAATRVLDVGCSAGQFGRVLIEQKGCTVFGVDLSSEAVHQAKQILHAAEVMDVEKDPMPFTDRKFEVILFGDVLEHLLDAQKVLMRFKQYLTTGGVLVVSIPNVANISIRLRLLLGRWEYQPSGILDEGHVRFYTLKTMRTLFSACGLRVVRQGSAPRFRCKTLTRLWPTLLANQFIFVLRP